MQDRNIHEIEVRPFTPDDAEQVSQLIATTMRRSNSEDYPLARLEPLISYFSPDKLRQLAAERHCLIAQFGGDVVGTAALDGDHLATFFVHPSHQGRGVGTRLLMELEAAARGAGVAAVRVDASVTGVAFYERRGYRRTGEVLEGTAGPQVELVKRLYANADERGAAGSD